MEVSVIILNYYTAELINELVSSILKTHSSNFISDCELIIVNNSYEEKRKLENVRIKYQNSVDIKVIHSKINLYFANGVNLALKYCKGKYILLLNSDIYFEDNSIEKLITFLKENTKYGMVGGKIIDKQTMNATKTGSNIYSIFSLFLYQSGIYKFFEIFNKYPKFFKKDYIIEHNPNLSKEMDVLCDAFLLIRKELFTGFNENLFLYYTEEDLAQKIKKLGYKSFYLADAYVIHNWSYATRKLPQEKILAIKLWDLYHYVKFWYSSWKAKFIIIGIILINFKYLSKLCKILKHMYELKKENLEIQKFLNNFKDF